MLQSLLPPLPPANRATALKAAGMLLMLGTAPFLVEGHWLTYLPPVLGLVVCYTGMYLNTRKPRE